MCNLPQFSQAAAQSKISDGDYRTYMILCSLALDNFQETSHFTVDLTYAEIGQSHPKQLSAAGVRSRINRLVKAGLISRQRIDNKRWRTIPAGDNLALIPKGVATENAQAAVSHNTQTIGVLPATTPTPTSAATHNTQIVQPLPHTTPTALDVASDNTLAVVAQSTHALSPLPFATPTDLTVANGDTQSSMTVAIENTLRTSPLPVSTHTTLPATDDNTQSLVSVATKHTQPAVSETKHGTQVSLTVTDEETQNNVHVLYAENQILVFDGAMKPLGRKVDKFVDTEPFSEEEDEGISDKEFMNRGVARRRLVRMAIESADAIKNGEVIEGVGVAAQNTPSLINDLDHDDINKSSIHDQDQNQSNSMGLGDADGGMSGQESMLATVLANLPQPMSPNGIVECTAEPELCAAWLDYATNPNAGVRNPAAYVRKGIRSGQFPPPIQKTYISPNSPIYKPSYTEMLNSQQAAN